MDAGLISAIVNGAVSLSSSFIQFGAQVYAVDHTAIPQAPDQNFQINLPAKQQGVDLVAVALVVFLIVIALIIGFIVYKKL